MDIKPVLAQLAARTDLSRTEMRAAMEIIMSGGATPAQTGAFLMGMRMKGESVEEIAAAVSILREKMVPVDAPVDAIDIVGTGGDGAGTLNISTATAFVVAASGVAVAKHGNKALSSKSGSSDALTSLGVKLDLKPAAISKCITQAGLGFMFAPYHHPAMKHVGPARAEMAVRTMFNLLGPQSNPARVKRYLLGVYAREWVEPVAASLLANGAESAWVVYGSDGLDEITTTGPTHVAAIENGALRSFTIAPEDAELPLADSGALAGGDPAYNAAQLRNLLGGAKSAYRDIVLLNAAAGLVVAGKAKTLVNGVQMAADNIDSGRANDVLEKLIQVSNNAEPT